MRLVRFLLNLQTIYFKQTVPQIIIVYLIVGLLIGIAVASGQNNTDFPWYTFVPIYLVAAYLFTRTVIRTLLVNKYIRQHPESLLVVPSTDIFKTSIYLELNKIDRLKPIAADGDTKLLMAMFDFYNRTRYGDYLSKRAYYMVIEIQLRRRLPHILFDSKVAKDRQFKSLYLQAQRIGVQSYFDEIFDTYVPQTYAIDSLSFITPEVMEVLIEARLYDIEIVNDKLFLYAPLIGKEDIEIFMARGKAIAEHLNDNVDTYRDDRLKADERKTSVTLFARSLLRSPKKFLIIAGLCALIIVALFYSAAVADPQYKEQILFNQFSVLLYLFFITNCWKAGKIIRDNKDALEHYRILHHTNRGEPIKHTIM